MKIVKNEEAVSPVIGVILMVAITVILAAVIAAFVFNIGGTQTKAPMVSVQAGSYSDTSALDLKITHAGGDLLKGGFWKLSIVSLGTSPVYVTSATGSDFGVGNMIITTNYTNAPGANVTNSTVTLNTASTWTAGQKIDIKLVDVPSNSMLLDTVVEIR